ncbi:hypothetical protein MMC30_000706 [Trapelia coarctata]|nr:hypothetical protein [Trapelia coarctata]
MAANTTATSSASAPAAAIGLTTENNALPENGAAAPALRKIDGGFLLRAITFGLSGILWDAGFSRPQFGLFLAGGREVLAILLGEEDVSRWEEVDTGVGRLCRLYAGERPVPVVRYWARETGKGKTPVGGRVGPVIRVQAPEEEPGKKEKGEGKGHERVDSGTFLAVPEPCYQRR